MAYYIVDKELWKAIEYLKEQVRVLWVANSQQLKRISRSSGRRFVKLFCGANKTPTEIAALVWEMTKANLSWGRIRITNELKLLGIYLSASTVRNILQRPRPRDTPTTSTTAPEKNQEEPEARSIPAWYPNHVWSIDTTEFSCWGLWAIEVLVAIDHFSRKVVCVAPLEGPNAGGIIEALEQAMRKHGAPKHVMSDQASVFTGDAFAEPLGQWNIKPRFGAVGRSGSIAVTERVIKTLKYEWLKHVPLIKGLDHFTSLCSEFESWYNTWRPHMTLEGFRPDDLYYSRKPEVPKRKAKTVPSNTERHVFIETRITAYRLKSAA